MPNHRNLTSFFSFLQLLFSNTGIASSNFWELLELEARLFFRQFVIIDGDKSLLICHGLKRVDRCSFDHEGRNGILLPKLF